MSLFALRKKDDHWLTLHYVERSCLSQSLIVSVSGAHNLDSEFTNLSRI
jgi:hypothetical protein